MILCSLCAFAWITLPRESKGSEGLDDGIHPLAQVSGKDVKVGKVTFSTWQAGLKLGLEVGIDITAALKVKAC